MPAALYGLWIMCAIAFIVGLTLSLTLPRPSDQVSNKPELLGFGTLSEEYHFMQTMCPCRPPEQWNLGTNERELSNQFFDQHAGELVNDERGLSSLAVFFGQFIDHTIVLSQTDPDQPLVVIPFNEEINMNISRVKFRPAEINPECREPQTGLSPLLDGSSVYSDYLDADRLAVMRVTPESCELISTTNHLGEEMPMIKDGSYYCGDQRCPEHVVLTAIHTLYVREHNRLCGLLKTWTPSRAWTSNEQFYKARQMVIWQQQRIVYNEWLPAVFGSQSYLLESIVPKSQNARIATEFAGAAFRWHTMVPNQVGPWPLEQLFFNSTLSHEQGADTFLKEALAEPASRADLKTVDTLRNKLFGHFGLDLIAHNLFRAREIGMGTYSQLCACYGLEPQNDHEDPMLGMLSEPVIPGSSLPPLMAHICAEQFKRLRIYDHNYYLNHIGQENVGVQQQVLEATLRKLISDNTNLGLAPKGKSVFFL